METAETLTATLANLSQRGFTNNFIIKDDSIYCQENNMKLNPDDFEIVEYYSFEGMSDLEDNAVAYAIKSDKLNIKGVLVDAYGAYSNPIKTDFISKIKKSNSILKPAKLQPVQ